MPYREDNPGAPGNKIKSRRSREETTACKIKTNKARKLRYTAPAPGSIPRELHLPLTNHRQVF
jgi:hypothetical protein